MGPVVDEEACDDAPLHDQPALRTDPAESWRLPTQPRAEGAVELTEATLASLPIWKYHLWQLQILRWTSSWARPGSARQDTSRTSSRTSADAPGQQRLLPRARRPDAPCSRYRAKGVTAAISKSVLVFASCLLLWYLLT